MAQQIDIENKSKELKKYISQFEATSFVTQTCFLTNIHLRSGFKYLKIKSPIRQLSYLVSLYLSTEPTKGRIYEPITDNNRIKLETLLEEIESGYRYNYLNELSNENIDYEFIEKLEITNPTYLNYFVNGVLNFTEQEIDRIQRVFKPFESHIVNKTGLTLDDYLNFFEITENIEISKILEYHQLLQEPGNVKILEAFKNDKTKVNSIALTELFSSLEKAIHNMCINIDELTQYLPKDKIIRLLNIFSVQRQRNDEYLFYTQECVLLKKPIVKLHEDSFIFLYQKQLIHAIYLYLFEVCLSLDEHGTKIHKQKEIQLEEKTKEAFTEFLCSDAKIY
jgi:hypothetical protein